MERSYTNGDYMGGWERRLDPEKSKLAVPSATFMFLHREKLTEIPPTVHGKFDFMNRSSGLRNGRVDVLGEVILNMPGTM